MRGRLHPALWLASALAVGAVCPPSQLAAQTSPIRVNAGGSAYTDGMGNLWGADAGFNTGPTAVVGGSIAGTTDDTLYQSLRWDGASAPELEYEFTVPTGFYEVKLLFAETWSGAYSVGARLFSVELEGQTVLQNLDVYAEAGAAAALAKTASSWVTDGTLTIRFVHVVDNPFVNAIEVKTTTTANPSPPTNIAANPVSPTQIDLSWTASLDDVGVASYEVERCEGSCTSFALVAGSSATSYQDSGLTPATTYRYRLRAVDTGGNYSSYSLIKTAATQGSTPPAAIRINAGGSAYTDTQSNVWSADTGYNASYSGVNNVPIAGTVDDTLYQWVRWSYAGSQLEYEFPVPAGQYQVNLHFAENWSGAFYVGGRVFDVQLEGTTILSSLDVFAEAGASTALVKTATATVSDGYLNLRFVHAPDTPYVQAIEVFWAGSSDPTAPSAPSGLSATPNSGTAINLTWTASSDNVAVAGYAIERCVGDSCSNFTEIATTTGTSRFDTGLSPDTDYRYRVRAYDAAGNRSAYSGVAEATTANATAEYVYDELGRLASVTIASGASIVYAYDESGNVTAIVRAAP